MIVFWKPPAMQIFGISFVAGLLFGYILLHSILGMDEITANAIGVTLGCTATVIWDIKFRKDNSRGLGDVAVSSFFGLIPTWLAGIIFSIFIWINATGLTFDRPESASPTPKLSRQQTNLLASVSEKGKIVFESASSSDWNLYSVNPDGSDLRLITEGGSNADCSPDGKHIVAKTTEGAIFTVNLDGTDRVEIVPPSNTVISGPKQSPDGKQIVYLLYEIHIINADGSKQIQPTSDNKYKGNPVWTPKGQIAYYELGGSEDNTYYVMNKDGSNTKEITKEMYDDYMREWSSDTRAYVAKDPVTFDITFHNRSGSVSVALPLDEDINAFNPAWCP